MPIWNSFSKFNALYFFVIFVLCERTCVNWFKKIDLSDFATKDQLCYGWSTVLDNDYLNEYIATYPKATSLKMSLEFNCNQKTIIFIILIISIKCVKVCYMI